MAIVYPATILIYLGKYPRTWWKQISWIIFWVIIYVGFQYIDLRLNLLNHYYGWNMWWSFVFDIVMFIMLRIHHKNPLLAWLASSIWLIFLWNVFDIPIKVLK